MNKKSPLGNADPVLVALKLVVFGLRVICVADDGYRVCLCIVRKTGA